MHRMLARFLSLQGAMCIKVSRWHICIPKRQLNLHRYVLSRLVLAMFTDDILACDSSCGTCVGSSTFCLSCSGSQLASGGKCVQSCPENTFKSSSSCLSCHP